MGHEGERVGSAGKGQNEGPGGRGSLWVGRVDLGERGDPEASSVGGYLWVIRGNM